MSNLSECSPACNCMKCNPSKSSCIALRASELNLPHIDSSTLNEPAMRAMSRNPTVTEAEMVLNELMAPKPTGILTSPLADYELPVPVRFSDLPDGTLFYLAQTYAYGGRKKLIKTLEDGGPHNAVYNEYGGIGIQVHDDRLVIRAGDKS